MNIHHTGIQFDELAQPTFESGNCFFKAQLDGQPVRVGVTHDALMHLLDLRPDMAPLKFLDAMHPGFARARRVIQRKFAEGGLNGGDGILITAQDLAQ